MSLSIYQVGQDGYWTGSVREIDAEAGAPHGWTREPVPPLSEGEFAVWAGAYWTITVQPPGVVPLDTAKELRLSHLAARRYMHETSGITVDGVVWPTDRDSRTALMEGAWAAAQSEAPLVWKVPAGWVTVTAAGLIQVAIAVRGHVQACYDHERALAALIDAAETTDGLAAIDIHAGWPA